jgi:hypothetical protein
VSDTLDNSEASLVGAAAARADERDTRLFLAGRAVDDEGALCDCEGSAALWEPLSLAKGERLVWLDPAFEYRLVRYLPGFPAALSYTYSYQSESLWHTYDARRTTGQWFNDDFVAEREELFRLIIRRVDGEVLREDLPSEKLYRIERLPKPACKLAPWYQAELEAMRKRIEARRKPGDLALLVLADVHYAIGNGWEQAAEVLRAVTPELGIDAVVQLGDLTDGLTPAFLTQRFAGRVLSDLHSLGLPVYGCLGNHDANYFRGNVEVMGRAERARFYLGRDESWYYVDYPEQRLRLLFTDTYDSQNEQRYGFLDEELPWLRQTLASTPKDYGLVVFSHVPVIDGMHVWSETIRNGAQVIRELEDYDRRTGNTVIAYVHGHNHADQLSGDLRFPVVSIGCAKFEQFEENKPAGSATPHRTWGTATQQLWDVLLVHGADRSADFIRFGAGLDRELKRFDEGSVSVRG